MKWIKLTPVVILLAAFNAEKAEAGVPERAISNACVAYPISSMSGGINPASISLITPRTDFNFSGSVVKFEGNKNLDFTTVPLEASFIMSWSENLSLSMSTNKIASYSIQYNALSFEEDSIAAAHHLIHSHKIQMTAAYKIFSGHSLGLSIDTYFNQVTIRELFLDQSTNSYHEEHLGLGFSFGYIGPITSSITIGAALETGSITKVSENSRLYYFECHPSLSLGASYQMPGFFALSLSTTLLADSYSAVGHFEYVGAELALGSEIAITSEVSFLSGYRAVALRHFYNSYKIFHSGSLGATAKVYGYDASSFINFEDLSSFPSIGFQIGCGL